MPRILAIKDGNMLEFKGDMTPARDCFKSFYDGEKVRIDVDIFSGEDFYLYLSASIAFIEKIALAFNEKYEEDKIKFYSLAINSAAYNKIPKLQERLETEINIKRFLGIFIAAESNAELYNFIVDTFVDFYPELSHVKEANINSSTIKRLYLKLESDYNESSNINALSRLPLMSLYVALANHDIDSPKIKSLMVAAKNYISFRNLMINNIKHKSVSTSWANKGYTHITEKRKAIESLSNTKHMGTLIDLLNAINLNQDLKNLPEYECEFLNAFFDNIFQFTTNDGSEMLNLEFGKNINFRDGKLVVEKDFYKIIKNDVDAANALHYLSIFIEIAEQFDYSATVLFGEKEITSDLRKRIYTIITQFQNIDCMKENGDCYFSFSLFLLAMIFYVLFEELSKQKELYFKYNSETQFFALHDFEKKINELEEIIVDLKDENEALSSVISEHNNKLSEIISTPQTVIKDISREAIATYEASISARDKEIEKLKIELEKARAKNTEVDRLRELVFEYEMPDLPDSKVSLVELIAAKKIIIIGGHINWQNKMRETYPDITIIDGHVSSIDTAIFDNADLVLFNTANMSHKVYYKLIDVFRGNRIKYDYLGRVTNSSLLEKEIAYLIEKNL